MRFSTWTGPSHDRPDCLPSDSLAPYPHVWCGERGYLRAVRTGVPVSASRFRVDEPNVYRWGFVPDEPCHVVVVDETADGWRAYVEWTVRPDGRVRPSGWCSVSKLATCPSCEGSREVPSASGLSDVPCMVCTA